MRSSRCATTSTTSTSTGSHNTLCPPACTRVRALTPRPLLCAWVPVASVCPVQRFWRVLESFTPEERVLFLKFCWGRTRLPAAGRWGNTRQFKLSKQVKQGTNDSTLPMAHTCFFEVELPPYSTEAILRKRLLTAMHFSTGYTGFR